MLNLWPLLLPASAWSGWWIATKYYVAKDEKTINKLSREYIVGLNYLLNEQSDKAVDIFIKLLEVDSDTVETHLALGSLFRRRGEVDRAIRIHQNLIARPQLSLSERKESLIALGHDYMSAGLFDRAENIFIEILNLGGMKEVASLNGLLAIYQQEKAWENALDILKKLEISTGQSFHVQAAHYYCEIAQNALQNNLIDKAVVAIKQSLNIDKMSVRASLLQAELDIQFQRYEQAIAVLKTVLYQDPDFLSEIIESLVKCYTHLDSMDECIEFLSHTIEMHPKTKTIFVIAEHLRKQHDLDYAIDFVAEKLSISPSIRGLNKLIYWHLETAYGKVYEKLKMLYDITSKVLDNKPIYRCCNCGFSGKYLHWHCPGCKQWGKIKPIHGLEGD